MNYSSTTEFRSTVCPGLVFKLKKMSHGRRMEYNQIGAPVFQKLAGVQREREPLEAEIKRAEDAAIIEPCSCHHPDHDPETKRCKYPGCECRKPKPEDDAYRRLDELQSKVVEIVVNDLYPVRFRWGVKTIEGFEIDGQPATVDLFLSSAPEELIREVADEIDRVMKLSVDEQLGFKSPSTSGALADGETLNSNAPTAEDAGSTQSVPA